MVVKFPLNLIGSASFVVLDTDYDNYGLICTCQDMNLWVTYAHRRSCSLLHRDPEADNTVTADNMKKLLDSQVDDASHDFDKISHSSCSYDTATGLNIDVDKIIGGGSDLMSDEDYDLYYGDFEPDAEILSKSEVEKLMDNQ